MPTAKKSTKKATKKATKKTAKKTGGKKKTAGKKAAKKASPRKKASPAKKVTPKKKVAAKKKAAPKRAKRAPNPAFMRPLTPSPELGAVVGARPMPRTEVTKRIWDYIKKNKLQDQTNRRMINADENLQKLFGGRKQVSMFEMTKLINNHLK